VIEHRVARSFEIAERVLCARSCASRILVHLSELTDGRIPSSMIGRRGRATAPVHQEARLPGMGPGTTTPAYLLCVEAALPLTADNIDVLAM
jgi:hypothetical protein